MIALSPSLWSERKGECPNCEFLVKVGVTPCPHCGYKFSDPEIRTMNKVVEEQFKRSALIGLLVFVALFMVAGLLFW
jgi:hypothetical protein